MIQKEIHNQFEKLEKEYTGRELVWLNYSSLYDWSVDNNKIVVVAKNTSKENVRASLRRAVSHEMRDSIIVHILKKLGIKTVLDVGSDTGLFLAKCKEHSIEGIGIEPNKKAAEYVNSKEFIRLYCFDLQCLTKNYVNNNRIDLCSFMDTFHGEWANEKEKIDFARYLANNFKYVILSDDYKGNKPDPVIAEYFDLVYDFNLFGDLPLKERKKVPKIMKFFKKTCYDDGMGNNLYEKLHILAVHKLYISKSTN